MLQTDNPGQYVMRLWFILGEAFLLFYVLFGAKLIKKVMRTAFGMLTVSAIYFAFILYVNNYICTPALGQQWSGVVSLALILAPVALYEINEKMS